MPYQISDEDTAFAVMAEQDGNTWAIAAYADYGMADSHAKAAKKWVRDFVEQYDDYLGGPSSWWDIERGDIGWVQSPYDPRIDSLDIYGVEYWVSAVPLRYSLPVVNN